MKKKDEEIETLDFEDNKPSLDDTVEMLDFEMDKKVSNEIDEMLDFLDVSTNDNKENERELENEKEKGTSMRKKAPWERRKAS